MIGGEITGDLDALANEARPERNGIGRIGDRLEKPRMSRACRRVRFYIPFGYRLTWPLVFENTNTVHANPTICQMLCLKISRNKRQIRNQFKITFTS